MLWQLALDRLWNPQNWQNRILRVPLRLWSLPRWRFEYLLNLRLLKLRKICEISRVSKSFFYLPGNMQCAAGNRDQFGCIIRNRCKLIVYAFGIFRILKLQVLSRRLRLATPKMFVRVLFTKIKFLLLCGANVFASVGFLSIPAILLRLDHRINRCGSEDIISVDVFRCPVGVSAPRPRKPVSRVWGDFAAGGRFLCKFAVTGNGR